jgi:hypothetical protein
MKKFHNSYMEGIGAFMASKKTGTTDILSPDIASLSSGYLFDANVYAEDTFSDQSNLPLWYAQLKKAGPQGVFEAVNLISGYMKIATYSPDALEAMQPAADGLNMVVVDWLFAAAKVMKRNLDLLLFLQLQDKHDFGLMPNIKPPAPNMVSVSLYGVFLLKPYCYRPHMCF